MKIIVLVENTSNSCLACEHGLSLLIEHMGRKILLDAGSTRLFSENAVKMGISLAEVDFAVLSHGHYDHSGGFSAFFEQNHMAPVYARREITEKYYSANGGMHEIGVPAEVLAHSERFVFVAENTELEKGIYLVAHGSGELAKIGAKSNLYRKENTQMVPDDFRHEQSLVLDTEKGLVIFNSCSHGGVENIIREARDHCRNKPVHAYLGGLHMKGKNADGEEICAFSDNEIDNLCAIIRKEKIAQVYTGHCTGKEGFEKLKARLGERVQMLGTGTVIEL